MTKLPPPPPPGSRDPGSRRARAQPGAAPLLHAAGGPSRARAAPRTGPARAGALAPPGAAPCLRSRAPPTSAWGAGRRSRPASPGPARNPDPARRLLEQLLGAQALLAAHLHDLARPEVEAVGLCAAGGRAVQHLALAGLERQMERLH